MGYNGRVSTLATLEAAKVNNVEWPGVGLSRLAGLATEDVAEREDSGLPLGVQSTDGSNDNHGLGKLEKRGPEKGGLLCISNAVLFKSRE